MAPTEMDAAIVVMGVSGCGKSTIGAALARRTGRLLIEGDDLHPAANVAKMRAGVPLTDDDREPWLAAIVARMDAEHVAGQSLVVTCSALRRSYREQLRAARSGCTFIHLTADRDELARRISARTGHFMPVTLLDSQLATLEPLGEDEGIVVTDGVDAGGILKLLGLRSRTEMRGASRTRYPLDDTDT